MRSLEMLDYRINLKYIGAVLYYPKSKGYNSLLYLLYGFSWFNITQEAMVLFYQ